MLNTTVHRTGLCYALSCPSFLFFQSFLHRFAASSDDALGGFVQLRSDNAYTVTSNSLGNNVALAIPASVRHVHTGSGTVGDACGGGVGRVIQ